MRITWLSLLPVTAVLLGGGPRPSYAFSDTLATGTASGLFGGRLVVAQRSEPRTLNPFTALDASSKEAIGLLHSDLIHINRKLLKPEPSLASSWSISKDARIYTMRLRRGVRFSDGHPLTADDILFTFRVHLDEQVNSSQRETLLFGGKPIAIRKLDHFAIEFTLAVPSASAERVFDSVVILPEHLLGPIYRRGEITKAWPLTVSPSQIAGLGAFRLKEHVAGQRIIFERNPHYWKVDRSGKRLPYLNEIVFEFVGSEDAQRLHFEAGQSHLIAGMNPLHFLSLLKTESGQSRRMVDHGPGLEYSFLVFNQNDSAPTSDAALVAKQKWFRQTAFRQAVSAAIDRSSIVRIAYGGLASPIWTHVTAGNAAWLNRDIPQEPRSLSRARQLLAKAQFRWDASGRLLDQAGQQVAFSIVTSAGNAQRVQIATIIQDDLKQLGIKTNVVALEFRSMLNRVFETHEYDAAVMTLASGDTDPNAEMNVWTSKGSTRVWKLRANAQTTWELELDGLMHKQASTLHTIERKRLYDRVQQIVAEQLPIICVASSHVLVGSTADLANVEPSILRPYVLGSVDQIYFRKESARR